MIVYASEDEQVEILKKWWQQNGRSVIIGAVIGIGGVLGWKAWIDYKDNRLQQASSQYSQMVQSVKNKKFDLAQNISKQLIDAYDNSPYAGLSALLLSKVKYEQGQKEDALQQLNWVMNNTKATYMKHLARIRSARIMLDTGKADAAKSLIEKVEQDKFTSLYEELLGDIYTSLNDHELARKAYQKALLAGTTNRDFIQMKLDDLGLPKINISPIQQQAEK